ncbi:MAG: MarR family winged helix-turn-helix transcriptional regulator [Hyphomonadaceae bacterium]
MTAPLAREIAAVRRFNRFYTREVGALRKTFLDTPFSLGEARVLLEIRQRPGVTARDIGAALDLDAAYLSRLLAKFEKDKLITRSASAADARQYELQLTSAGAGAVGVTDARQAARTQATLQRLSPAQRKQLVEAMATIETLLSPP